jgi:hypothetical protein
MQRVNPRASYQPATRSRQAARVVSYSYRRCAPPLLLLLPTRSRGISRSSEPCFRNTLPAGEGGQVWGRASRFAAAAAVAVPRCCEGQAWRAATLTGRLGGVDADAVCRRFEGGGSEQGTVSAVCSQGAHQRHPTATSALAARAAAGRAPLVIMALVCAGTLNCGAARRGRRGEGVGWGAGPRAAPAAARRHPWFPPSAGGSHGAGRLGPAPVCHLHAGAPARAPPPLRRRRRRRRVRRTSSAANLSTAVKGASSGTLNLRRGRGGRAQPRAHAAAVGAAPRRCSAARGAAARRCGAHARPRPGAARGPPRSAHTPPASARGPLTLGRAAWGRW